MVERDLIILERIKELEIDCPDCEDLDMDDQYTCVTCWCEGGNGRLNVMDYLKEKPYLLEYKT